MILLQCPREKLYDKITKRVDLMLEKGLKEEAFGLIKYKNFDTFKNNWI